MKVSTTTIESTKAEREAFEERERKTQAMFERMAAGTLDEQQRLGAQMWAEHVERPRAVRRIATARRAKTRPTAARAPRRTNGSSGRPRAQAARSSAKSGDSGDDAGDQPPAEPWRWRWASPAAWREIADRRGVVA